MNILPCPCPEDDYHALCDVSRCGKELWGLEPMVLVEGPRVVPGRPGGVGVDQVEERYGKMIIDLLLNKRSCRFWSGKICEMGCERSGGRGSGVGRKVEGGETVFLRWRW